MSDVVCKNESCGKRVDVSDKKCWWCECENPGSESVAAEKIQAANAPKRSNLDPSPFHFVPFTGAPSIWFPAYNNTFDPYGMNP